MDQSKQQHFYRWEDGQGRVHITSSVEDVPPAQRAKAERVVLDGTRSAAVASPLGRVQPWKPDVPSVGLGLVGGVLVTLLLSALPARVRWLWRLVLVAALALAGTLAYLGAIRRATGSSDSVLAAPSAIIQDAKSAVEQMNQRQQLQAEELRRIQAEGRGEPMSGSGK